MLPRAWVQTLSTVALLVLVAGDATSALEGEDLRDGQITDAINNEFLTDRSVPFHRIDVRTDDGIVTLSGRVLNLMQKQRATEVALAIRGVRSVVNDIDVVPASRSDAVIRRDVVRALTRHPVTETSAIDMAIDSGVVTLRGEVESWAEKETALNVARGVRGVRDVGDDLRVVSGVNRADHELEADIAQRLDMDARINAELIEVSVSEGRVKLAGTVGSAAERYRAYSDAWVAGVTAVEADTLEVEGWAHDKTIRQGVPSLTDPVIEDAIRAAFRHDPRVRPEDLVVRVEDGVATLRGEVARLEASRAAEMDARHTTGVRRVRNYVRVRPVESPTDAELASQVRSELRADSYLDESAIAVRVSDGTVYLSRTVNSHWEKVRAEEAASKVDGVVDVVNNLVVAWPVEKNDWEIAEDVRQHLYWNPFISADEIKVKVENGTVTLSGVVDSSFERNAATDEAHDGGAISVRNNLAVRL